ncbi:MAG: hypothetical protein Q7T33_00725 [Dehalococcoidia bacterium]|nr:hypothetical protein [Dehalococcoidia bacterium]
MAKPKSQEPESPAEWLESQLRETRARLHKVEGELQQTLKHMWSLDADVRKMAEASAVAASASSALQGFREEVRQVHDQMSRLQDRQAALTNRLAEISRLRESARGGDRPELGSLTKQMDANSRALEQYDTRMKALGEVARHIEEEVAGNRLAGQALERAMEEASTRTARAHEVALRLDQDTARFTSDIEKLEKVDVSLAERLNLLLEQLRRAGERLDKLEGLAAFPDEARELLQRAAFERDQLTQRLGQVERLAAEVAERMQEFVQGVARLDQRSQTQAADLLGLTGQLQELSEQTKAALKRIFGVLLRQRRRQAEAMAQEIKELTQGELHSGD